ncbi:hypothetical protein [Stutzerimonas kunmingensis]|uniref:hypothetical protein n=1 Tax=Stutzerimonas kunmingensis TaxID=1211807 RepID=UPI00241FF635|nr:hypothetical protein [Stutzerimonas kunmingensis]
MTNEERRRASGAAMEASRRESGAAMEASRRAGGAAMIERRTGKSVAEDIRSLTAPQRQARSLPRVDQVGALPAQRGTGTSSGPASGGATGGGIASPLIETAGTREFHPSILRASTDGAVFFEVRAAKKVTMTDANGEPVVLEFQDVNS